MITAILTAILLYYNVSAILAVKNKSFAVCLVVGTYLQLFRSLYHRTNGLEEFVCIQEFRKCRYRDRIMNVLQC